MKTWLTILAAAVGLATAAAETPPQPAAVAPLVVVDPGHGGSNTGAAGSAAGVLEKHFTLALARQLVSELDRRGVAAMLTRDRDRFLSLRKRAEIANRANAAVFVSVHANASRDHAQRGFETYVLSPRALDVDARALRTGSGRDRSGVAPRIDRLLDDVERGLAQSGSAELAAAIQRRLAAARQGSPNRGVKQDAMHVLLGATMPAVLVEVGFIDHPVEGEQLVDARVQKKIASAIATAIGDTLGLDPLPSAP